MNSPFSSAARWAPPLSGAEYTAPPPRVAIEDGRLIQPAPSTTRPLALWALRLQVLILCLLGAGLAHAHEVPTQVHLDLWAAHEGERLEVVVRAPLAALRDVSVERELSGALDLETMRPRVADAAHLWVADYMRASADGDALPPATVLAARIGVPDPRPGEDFEAARARAAGAPLPPASRLYWETGVVDILLAFALPPGTTLGDLRLQPGLAHLGLTTASDLRIRNEDGSVRRLRWIGDPGAIALGPGMLDAASTFVRSGLWHILSGTDHVLFLLCLVLPLLRLRPLIAIVTAFTVAHSITLIASALGLLPHAAWFPPLIEALIAASILWMALENLLARWPGSPLGGVVGAPRHRWRLAFAFGLVHGFGFAVVLAEDLQYAGDHLLIALLSFNLGVEFGQLLLLCVAVPVLRLVAGALPAGALVVVASVLIAHTAWHWLLERATVFSAYPIAWPAADLTALRGTLQVLMLALVAGAGYWLLGRLFDRWLSARRTPQDTVAGGTEGTPRA